MHEREALMPPARRHLSPPCSASNGLSRLFPPHTSSSVPLTAPAPLIPPLPIAGARRDALHRTAGEARLLRQCSRGECVCLMPAGAPPPPSLPLSPQIRPTSQMLVGVEPTLALSAMLSEPAAVGGYDKVPLMAASGVFTLDLSTQMFTLHSAQVWMCARGD